MEGSYSFPSQRLVQGKFNQSISSRHPIPSSPPKKGSRLSPSLSLTDKLILELIVLTILPNVGSTEKTPLVLVACGSYSPITFLHLRMFEMARDDAHHNTQFQVIGGYLSPVNDAYAKLGLASAVHRVNMCDQAVTETSDWLMVDSWEARQSSYTPTAQVLDHFDHELNTVRGGADVVVTDEETGVTRIEKRRIRIMLLAGSDLILTMSEPGVWAEKDVSPTF